ncbi:nicotinate-nucleotide adenylyltransferase [Desulfohalotomaculum tongense]|uniref:nicotinate-nucleotide adenylyltransferase n=1 Tax=Desulforadius tongensis TaxID=1216062 RepID=UPI0019598A4D|nr:nicotinate-nucleotide adenylyltransferase [Desulforadius tongensis]MBM7855686.1 nicotinate-nucleotide adenylyltransferase [Desulforadius tongensis]
MRSLAIMGGTFDPIHYGHLVAAEQARHSFQCEKVLFVPAKSPPHKDNSRISPVEHRLAMTRLAVDTNRYFEVSTLEIERPGPSYAIDTVKEVKKIYNPEKLYFITGADAVLEIISWKNVEELLSACYFVAATRPGYDISNLRQKLNVLPAEYLKKIIPTYIPALAISSTDIRKRVRAGESIKYLLPEPVERYIKNHRLYL